jgi:hypothetical protein
MKVTTEDCVEAIVNYFRDKNINDNSPLVNSKEWKRISKSGKGDSIIRVFRNLKTTDLINVTSSETKILKVSENVVDSQNVAKFNTFTTPKKITVKCKCYSCGSSNITLMISPSDEYEDGYEINPMKLNQKKAKKLIKNSDKSMWICHGDCEDETSAIVYIDNKKITDSDDYIEYVANFGNPIIDNIDITNIPKKTVDIIKAVKIGDLETVQDYINAGNDLDKYIGDLPENKNKTDIGEVNWTLLQFALEEQQWDVAIALINAGCDVNKPMRHISNTALMSLFWNKHTSKKIYDVIDALMANGVDLTVKGYNGYKGADIFDLTWESKKKFNRYIIDNYPEQYKEYLSKK